MRFGLSDSHFLYAPTITVQRQILGAGLGLSRVCKDCYFFLITFFYYYGKSTTKQRQGGCEKEGGKS